MEMSYRVDLFTLLGADAAVLNDSVAIEQCLRHVVEAAGFHFIDSISHQFQPQGISTVAILEESHIAAHTWPEKGSAYITLTTCAQPEESFVEKASDIIAEVFAAQSVNHREIL